MSRQRILNPTAIEIMKILALKGPETMYNLSNRVSGKPKNGLTKFAYPTIHKHVKRLLRVGYVAQTGITEKPKKHRGHPKGGSLSRKKITIKQNSKIKHETMLYGLSFVGLSYLFMVAHKVREEWKKVEENYPFIKRYPWFKLALDWLENPKLNIFPLKQQYEKPTRHYKPNRLLFIQSVIFSKVDKETFQDVCEEVINVVRENPRTLTMLRRQLEREIDKYDRILSRCRAFADQLEALAQELSSS